MGRDSGLYVRYTMLDSLVLWGLNRNIRFRRASE